MNNGNYIEGKIILLEAVKATSTGYYQSIKWINCEKLHCCN